MKKMRMSLGVQISILALSSSVVIGMALFVFMLVGMTNIEEYSIEQLSANMMEGYDDTISPQVDTAIGILRFFNDKAMSN